MATPAILQYGSMPGSLLGEECRGILRTSDGPRRVNQQNFSRFQKPLVKGLVAFGAANLAIGGSIVGLGAYFESGEAAWASMPFFANSMLGLFGLIITKNLQGVAQEVHDSLSL